MQALTATNILEIRERGTGCIPVKQALVILGCAFPEASTAHLASLSIGQRDACLLQLRVLTFGRLLIGLVTCPACGERLEMTFDSGDFQAMDVSDSQLIMPEIERIEGLFTHAPYEVTFRLPTSNDLGAIAGLADPALARRRLLEACVLDARKDGVTLPAGELPDDAAEALAEHISQADPLADLTLDFACPACQHRWQMIFDIVTFFWSEIEAWAVRLMREVHILASAYGWREADILNMSIWRRQRYLEMVGVEM